MNTAHTTPTPFPVATDISRRALLAGATLSAVAAIVPFAAEVHAQGATTAPAPPAPADDEDGVALRWLETDAPKHPGGTTFGLPWARGRLPKEAHFAVIDRAGKPVPAQTWPLAYWADGSVKWTAHALPHAGGDAGDGGGFKLRVVDAPPAPGDVLKVAQTDAHVTVDTGAAQWTIARAGEHLIDSVTVAGRQVLRHGRLVCLVQDGPSLEGTGSVRREGFKSRVDQVAVEQSGPVRAVVRLAGAHVSDAGRALLPFVVRLYFYAGVAQVRVVHTFIYDADEGKDFIAGLGVRFNVPMTDPAYDRHVRFTGAEEGLWAEAVQGITGLRRDPGAAVREAQVAGRALPPLAEWASSVTGNLKYVPHWGDYTLRQLSADGYDIRKRTKAGHAWVHAATDHRAGGAGYLGGAGGGGVGFGLRDFWQRHPAQLDVRGAQAELAEVTLWLWSPDAAPMDLRFYHDGLGQETHAQQLDALNITYEDYEPGFGSPEGIARTSELLLWPTATTPSRQAMVDFAAAVRTPPQVVASPATYLRAGVFGGLWSEVDRSSPARAGVEDRLDFLIGHYVKEVEQRRWYGFWDHGDVMHTYDADRHCWRYDVGGYAWDNSELSPDLWIWYTFLRTGRADVFRFGEAMTRHTGEVDVYHAGPFKGLGTRHNVQHWGCSAKQLRISTVVYRRFLYYLTADERVGDLMRELVDCDQTFLNLDPIRKIRKGAYEPRPEALAVGFGTDWGSIAIALFTEWERTGDERAKSKLLEGMRSIGAMPHGFFSGGLYDLATGRFTSTGEGVGVSHLGSVFGLPEIVTELLASFPEPAFAKAWFDYCQYYNAPRDERAKALGFDLRSGGLPGAHSRLTALAAVARQKPELKDRAWRELLGSGDAKRMLAAPGTTRVDGPAVLRPIDEAPDVSTNEASQWGLAAIQNLALIGDAIPALPEPR